MREIEKNQNLPMTPEELQTQIAKLIPHNNWKLHDNWEVDPGIEGRFTLWSEGVWLIVDEPAERVLFALKNPEEYDAELDAKLDAEIFGDLIP